MNFSKKKKKVIFT